MKIVGVFFTVFMGTKMCKFRMKIVGVFFTVFMERYAAYSFNP